MALSDYLNKYAKAQLEKGKPFVKALNAPAKKILATPAKKVVAPAKKVTPFVQTKTKPMPVAVTKKTLPVSSVATPTKAAAPKSKLIDSLRKPAQVSTTKTPLISYLSQMAKNSVVTPRTPKKTGLIESLKGAAGIIPQLPKAAWEFDKAMATFIPKDLASIYLYGKKKGAETPTASYEPTSKIGKFFLGDKISDFETSGQEMLNAVGGIGGLKERGIDENFAKKYGFAFGGALVLSDLIPGGGAKNKIAKEGLEFLRTTNDIKTVSKVLKSSGLADEVIAPFAKTIAGTSDIKVVKKAVKDVDKLSKGLKSEYQVAKKFKTADEFIKSKSSPLIEEAKKYKSAEDFVKGQGNPIYHGTAAKFEIFDPKFKGHATGAESAKGAFWFTDDPATAKAYAVYAAEDAPVQRLLKKADDAEKIAQRSGKESDWAKYEELVAESEKLSEYDATYARRQANANVKEAYVKGDFLEIDAKGKTPQELSTDDNIDSWLNSKIKQAIKEKKSGIKIVNIDDAVGLYDRPSTHYAVFDANQIKTKSQLTDIWNEAQKSKKLPSKFSIQAANDAERDSAINNLIGFKDNGGMPAADESLVNKWLDRAERGKLNKDDVSEISYYLKDNGIDMFKKQSEFNHTDLNAIWNEAHKPKSIGLSIEKDTRFGKTAKTSQKTTAQDALRGVESGKGIETSSILKMRESVKNKLKEIGKQKSNLVKTKQSIIDNDKNVSDIIMMNEAEKQARSSYVTKQFDGVKNAILNDKFYKKELSLSDNWQDAPIYKKGNIYRFAVTQEDKVKLIDNGYSFHGSIDEMANTADMDAETFLEKAFDEAVEGRNVGIEKQIHEHLMSSNSRYAELDEELSAVTSQLKKLKKTNANIEIELTKRTDKEITEKAIRDTLEAGKNKAGNLQKKVLSDLDAKKINKAFPTASVKEGEGSVDVLKKIQSVENKRELYNNPATRDKALHDLFYKPKVKAVSNSTGNETSQIIKKVKEAGQQPSEIRQSFSKDTTLKGLAKNTERATPEQLPRKLSARDEEFLNTPYNENKIKDIANIVEDMNTPVNKKVNLLDYIRTPNRVLNKIGLGKEADLLRTQYDKYAKELPKNIDKITAWSKEVPKESNQKIFQFLDGQEVTLNVKEAKVAGEIKTWLSEWADRLQLPKDNRISSYITHIFDQQLIKKEFDEDLAKIIAERVPGSVYDPFLLQRLGKLGYKEDTWAALDAYVKRATRKANLDPALEQISKKAGSLEESQWEYVKKYVDNVNMRPSNIDNLADNLIKSSPIEYKLGQRPTTNVLRKFRQATYRGMLGLNPTSAMRNLSQGANTYAKLGEKYTVLGYSKLLSPSARKEVAESGVLKNDFIQDRALSSTKKAVEKLDKGLFYMFETAEKINRGAAYWGAKSKALSQGKSESQAIDIAKKMVRDTQFAFDSIDTPVAMQGDIAKTLLQFQSYTTKQSEFLLEMYKNKEFAGLFRYSVSGLAFVYTLGTAFGMEPKELIPTYRFDTPPSMKLPVEIGKALLNSPDKYGNERSVSEKISDITKSGIGLIPAGSQMKKSYEGYSAINQGASTTSAGVKQFDVGGTQAKDAQALLFGKYANKEAKDYFSGTSYSESKMGKEERVINDLLKTKEIMNDKDTKKFKEAMKEGLKNGNIKPEDGIKLFKKLMTSQQNIKVKKVFEEIKDATPEEKKAAIKELNSEEIAALIKIIKDKAKE